jgi:hypothetical protein
VAEDAAPVEEGGSGPIVGEGGPLEGIRPRADSRLWLAPEAPVATAPKVGVGKPTASELQRGLAELLGAHNDSVALAARASAPPDWTFERGGKKYGIDRNKIYLGPVSLPTALLALLPLNTQGNPTAYERERALSAMSADIRYHAQQAVTDDEFKAAVRRIRERKERERREAEESRRVENANAPVP